MVSAVLRMKVFAFILIGVLIHFGLTFAIVVSRLSCGVQAQCVGFFNEVAGAILSFPLSLIVWGMRYIGIDSAVVTDSLLGGNIFALCLLNSIMAVVFVWYVLIKPVVRMRKYARSR